MRSPAEIAFRIRQELANLRLWKFPPALMRVPGLPKLPGMGARFGPLRPAPEIIPLAEEILRHRFPIFGGIIDTGPKIRWRRDYAHAVETGTEYFRVVPYLDFERAGDHKYIWELNRHQHLVVLAQAFRFTGNRAYLEEAQREVESWLEMNSYLRGINWTSALEVAFRALSWVWLDHIAGDSLPPEFRREFLQALYRHGRFLEENLSVYFSPNTHLLGEAVALHTLGSLYPDFPRSEKWRAHGKELVAEQMEKQVRADGSHFEQSTYYHVYALDLFRWHNLLAETTEAYREKLRRMTDYLEALLGPSGQIPYIGDDDGGRLFHPYGERTTFGRGPDWSGLSGATSRLFPDAGVAVMAAGDVQIVIKAGGFGASSAGHSHSDVLSFVCRQGAREILIDPGTYTYVADPAERNLFRGTAAHNTVRINERDQATAVGPFRWEGLPEARILQWATTAEKDYLDAECRYGGFRHRRRFLFLKPGLLLVFDSIDGPTGEHLIEQFWHFGDDPEAPAMLVYSQTPVPVEGWRSRVFGSKERSAAQCVVYRGTLPVVLAAAVGFDEAAEKITLEDNNAIVRFRSGRSLTVPIP